MMALIDDHGLADRDDDLVEHLETGAAVKQGGLIQRGWDGVHVALHHVESSTGTCGVHKNQRHGGHSAA